MSEDEPSNAETGNVWIQLGTRLHMICYSPSSGSHPWCWEIWTSTNKRTGDSSTWLGTFMRCEADGHVYQVTRRHDGESVIRIR